MKHLYLKGVFAGVASTVLGAVSNGVVIWANGGMPVHNFPGCKPGAVLDPVHVCASSFDHLSLLTDRIPAVGAIFSIGDLMMFAGITVCGVAFFFLVYTLIAERI